MNWGCAVVHEGTECEGNCRCDCDCTPCMHKALGIAKRQNKRWREMMAKQKRYIRPYENEIEAIHKPRTKEKIKVPTTTRK